MKNQKTVIYCKTVAKGKQAYFMAVDNEEYYLFTQSYRKSNREFFGAGVLLDDALDHSVSHSFTVHKTITKLIPHIEYIEKEFGLTVLRKTIESKSFNKKKQPYNRQKFKSNFNRRYAA